MGGVCGTHGVMVKVSGVLVGKLVGRRAIWRPERRWEGNVKMDLK